MEETTNTPAAEAGAHLKDVCDSMEMAMSAVMRGFFSDQTREHFRNARIEVLKGFRSILDSRIERLSRNERRGTTVTVE